MPGLNPAEMRIAACRTSVRRRLVLPVAGSATETQITTRWALSKAILRAAGTRALVHVRAADRRAAVAEVVAIPAVGVECRVVVAAEAVTRAVVEVVAEAITEIGPNALRERI